MCIKMEIIHVRIITIQKMVILINTLSLIAQTLQVPKVLKKFFQTILLTTLKARVGGVFATKKKGITFMNKMS